MKEVMDFLTANGVFYLATADGDQPQVRAMGFVMEYEGKLAFCTSNDKPMFKQMKANPKVSFCSVDKEMKTLRVCGKVRFCTSPESQKKALEVMPALANMYKVGDGKFEIFCLEDAKAIVQSMSGEVKTLL